MKGKVDETKERKGWSCGADEGGEVEMLCVGDRGLEGIIDLSANVSSMESVPLQGCCLNSLHR